MIDIVTYRLRIGCFNPGKLKQQCGKCKLGGSSFNYQFFEKLNREYAYYTFGLKPFFGRLNFPNRGFDHQQYERLKPLFMFYLLAIIIIVSTSLLIVLEVSNVA